MSRESARKHRARARTRDREAEVLARVRAIPEGMVATYGDVSPGALRFAGSVLFGAEAPELPWWRVVRADGSLAKGDRQRARLRAEGVPFKGDRVDMAPGRALPGAKPSRTQYVGG